MESPFLSDRWTGHFVDLQCTCCSVLHVSMEEPKRAQPSCGSRPAIIKLEYSGVIPTLTDPLHCPLFLVLELLLDINSNFFRSQKFVFLGNGLV